MYVVNKRYTALQQCRWTGLLCTQLYTAVQVDTAYTDLSLFTFNVKQLNCTDPDLSNSVVDNIIVTT